MKERLYSMYDRVAEEFKPVWEARNDQVAVRIVFMAMADPRVPVNMDDVELWCVGEFDHETGDVYQEKALIPLPKKGNE